MMQPQRIQLFRIKDWKMPPNTVKVCRPTKWGNPYTVSEYGRELAVANYRRRLHEMVAIGALDLSELTGKNLACWCKLGEPCHADVLLELANKQPARPARKPALKNWDWKKADERGAGNPTYPSKLGRVPKESE